jgi:hypothetical protein
VNRIKVNIPEGVSGNFRIEKIKTDNYVGSDEPLDTYTVLFNSSHNIMQDTTREYREHEQFLKEAHGNVIVGGLGLGMINQSLMENPNVLGITIIEKYQEVIDLVWQHCPKNEKIRLVHADIYEWKPDSVFDIGWFDSWCGENEHTEYQKLMNEKYGSFCKDIRFWKSFGSSMGWGNKSECPEN